MPTKDEYARNRDHLLEWQRDYRAKNKDRETERNRAYHLSHPKPPAQRFAYDANKYAKRKGLGVGPLDWRNLTLGPCAYCGKDDATVTWDHVIPLMRGGPNLASNCVRCCRQCNREKNAFTPEEWRDPGRIPDKLARRRARIRQWHRDHYAELYAKRKARREERGHW